MDTSIKTAKDKIKDKLFNPHDKRNLAKRLFGYCDCPYHKGHWFKYPSTIRMNTAYANEESNYITCCEDFYEDEVAPQIDEMWEEYYSERL